MKSSDICLLLSFVFIMLSIIFSINYIYEVKVQNIKFSYSDKIELALEGALIKSNENLNNKDINKMAVQNFATANFNKEKVIQEFLKLLDLNFRSYSTKESYMSRFVPFIMFIEDDGVTINVLRGNKRVMLCKVPYYTYKDNKFTTFKLTQEVSGQIEKDLKDKVIIDTIKKQFNYMNFEINIPYNDAIFINSIKEKSVIAIVKGLPFMKNECITKMKGKKINEKGKYIILDDRYYKKASIKKIYELVAKKDCFLKIYDTMTKAALDGYIPKIN